MASPGLSRLGRALPLGRGQGGEGTQSWFAVWISSQEVIRLVCISQRLFWTQFERWIWKCDSDRIEWAVGPGDRLIRTWLNFKMMWIKMLAQGMERNRKDSRNFKAFHVVTRSFWPIRGMENVSGFTLEIVPSYQWPWIIHELPRCHPFCICFILWMYNTDTPFWYPWDTCKRLFSRIPSFSLLLHNVLLEASRPFSPISNSWIHPLIHDDELSSWSFYLK